MAIQRKIGMQFKKPTGFPGKIVSLLMSKGNRPVYERMIKDLTINSNDKILEIGFGPGIGIHLISKRFETTDIYGIDFSELMYRRAAKRYEKLIKNNRVHLLFGDFIETEINDRGFDKIFCINVVYFWDNLQKPLEKINSLLSADGIFCCYMESKDDLSKVKFTKDDIFNNHSIEQVTKALKSAGFKETEYYFKKGYYIKAKI